MKVVFSDRHGNFPQGSERTFVYFLKDGMITVKSAFAERSSELGMDLGKTFKEARLEGVKGVISSNIIDAKLRNYPLACTIKLDNVK